eukprot:2394541-Lingulodinium_polyedra.AAC.1
MSRGPRAVDGETGRLRRVKEENGPWRRATITAASQTRYPGGGGPAVGRGRREGNACQNDSPRIGARAASRTR